MAIRQTSREFSARVKQQFQREGRPFRRWMNWYAVVGGVLGAGVLAALAAREHNRIYQAGPLSDAHRVIENDCAACHDRWAPVLRLIKFSDAFESAPNHKCDTCHEGPPHYLGQNPAHAGIFCAECHHEHRGDNTLLAASNQKCKDCHRDLDTHLASLKRSTEFKTKFNTSISDFATNHPDFRPFEKPDEARIKFNHEVHLKGVLNEKGQVENLAENCSACHVPDAQRHLMRPIQYEAHCQRCHPLFVDVGDWQTVVPHERPEVVLGFLTRYATLQVTTQDQDAADEAVPRDLPGVPYRPPLTAQQADEVTRRVSEAERLAQEHTHTLFGAEAQGGCRFCHEVTQRTSGSNGARLSMVEWDVAPPKILEQWFEHAEFSHDSHRILECVQCHDGVMESKETSDVLMPHIELCRNCHSNRPNKTTGLAGRGVQSRCIDCHSYHDRTTERFQGSLTVESLP